MGNGDGHGLRLPGVLLGGEGGRAPSPGKKHQDRNARARTNEKPPRRTPGTEEKAAGRLRVLKARVPAYCSQSTQSLMPFGSGVDAGRVPACTALSQAASGSPNVL